MKKKITSEQIEYFLGSDHLSKNDLLEELELIINEKYEVKQFREDVLNHWNYSKRNEEL